MVNKTVRDALAAFVAERDWAQFHTPENLAKSISIEAGELLECFQWSSDADLARVREELADVLTYCLLLAERIGADPEQIILAKLEITRNKYPVDKARGRSTNNWPVVYVLDEGHGAAQGRPNGLRDIYVGESLNAVARMGQHLKSPQKQHLSTIRVIIDLTFNKSVCLDLESYLIQMLAGDGAYRVLNRNNGIIGSNYYQRDQYREGFRNVFVKLAQDGIFTRSIPAIENSDLFRLSPFKALTEDQANSVEQIVKGFLADLVRGVRSTIVIQGDPGTGKTVVAIFLMKLLLDIKTFTSLEDLDSDS
ncbi:hypothetical protein PV08_11973 [Exophiala spinifera]|uniref:Uncharacterized protein n=1 Tax=Exophiala spinifera TaxID=91928 RepID=A0A0D1ZA20_9EURO|nr:uncharacterized protein PV08_11973 [Exophiala spinifera]KIW09872.1 hypothetical protein PV08_11973 [Exophiala spinifera]